MLYYIPLRGIIFCTIGVERRAGLDTLFPKTVTLLVKPAPTEFIMSGKRAIALSLLTNFAPDE
ncbi:MAG: hypothetical protein RLP02_08130 [Coleofasciculus sp. C2-GNP5-27]